MQGSHHAQRNADQGIDQNAGYTQKQRSGDSGKKFLNDRGIKLKGNTHIASQKQVRKKFIKLHGVGLVQTMDGIESRNILRRGALTQKMRRGVARNEIQDREDQDRSSNQHEQHPQ